MVSPKNRPELPNSQRKLHKWNSLRYPVSRCGSTGTKRCAKCDSKTPRGPHKASETLENAQCPEPRSSSDAAEWRAYLLVCGIIESIYVTRKFQCQTDSKRATSSSLLSHSLQRTIFSSTPSKLFLFSKPHAWLSLCASVALMCCGTDFNKHTVLRVIEEQGLTVVSTGYCIKDHITLEHVHTPIAFGYNTYTWTFLQTPVGAYLTWVILAVLRVTTKQKPLLWVSTSSSAASNTYHTARTRTFLSKLLSALPVLTRTTCMQFHDRGTRRAAGVGGEDVLISEIAVIP